MAYRKTLRAIRLERKLARCAAMRAAKERKRLAAAAEMPAWRRVGTLLIVVHAAPDGRAVAVQAHGRRDWFRCGSERAVRGALARMLWRVKDAQKGRVS